MKFASFTYEGDHCFGIVMNGDSILNLTKSEGWAGPKSFFEFVKEGSLEEVRSFQKQFFEGSLKEVVITNIEDVDFRWLAPIPRPSKNIFCVGKNYLDHAKEMGAEGAPTDPVIFSKVPTTVTAHLSPVLLHESVTNEVDYEGELAVIIGKEAKGVTRDKAMDYVFGFTILNDVTARDLQSKHQQFLLAKGLDTFAPMGPYVVDRDSFLPLESKEVVTKVNGEERQRGSFDLMIFSIPEIIATISAGITLEPGDIIATGTPKGVGKGFTPPKLLKNGDVVEIEIDGIGKLRNTFVSEK
ncbi:fumarylacetoacetate hydrolase family protein [Evansella sp. AB-rgal1]|uniref:fumarylacetoacetate hydrolase family protein n=1 Tax=Evansella sp. AB-rgal1 TaxID=3242696 RepID=UPI00359EB01B